MENESPETQAVWRKLRQAWIDLHKAEGRLHKLYGLLQEVEWSNRREGENAKALVSEALKGCQNPDAGWDWVDGLDLDSLHSHLTQVEQKLRAAGGSPLEQAEVALRDLFREHGYVVMCVEHITKHTAYTTRRCAVAIKEICEKPIEIVRCGTWTDAVKGAKQWLANQEKSQAGEEPGAVTLRGGSTVVTDAPPDKYFVEGDSVVRTVSPNQYLVVAGGSFEIRESAIDLDAQSSEDSPKE